MNTQIINVILTLSGIISHIESFVITGDNEGHKQFMLEKMEAYFLSIVKEKEPEMDKDEEYDHIENGYYDNGNGYDVNIVWSNKVHIDDLHRSAPPTPEPSKLSIKSQYVLGSTVNDGLLCKDGTGDFVVSTEFDKGEQHEGEIKLFDSIEDANAFIEDHGYYALEAIKYTTITDESVEPLYTEAEKGHLCKCLNCDLIILDHNPQTGAPLLSLNGNESELMQIEDQGNYFWACPNCQTDENLQDMVSISIRYTEAGKEAVMQICKKLQDIAETFPDINTNVYQWISNDLDTIDVKYLGNTPDGDRQEEYATNDQPMLTDTEAINLLNTRYNNTLTAIGK